MTRTPEEIRAEFKRNGISIASWAIANNFNGNLVLEVLAGRKKAIRGQSYPKRDNIGSLLPYLMQRGCEPSILRHFQDKYAHPSMFLQYRR